METRQLIAAICLAVAVYLLYAQFVYPLIAPTPPVPAVSRNETASAPADAGEGTSPATSQALVNGRLAFRSAGSVEPVTLGGGEGDALEMTLSPRGAVVERVRLTSRNPKTGRYQYAASADRDEPVTLLSPVAVGPELRGSFATPRIGVYELNRDGWALDGVVWERVEAGRSRAVFRTTLQDEAGAELLRVTKSYVLADGKPVVTLALEIENLTEQALRVYVTQDGPTGISREHMQYDMRRLMAATRDGRSLEAGRSYQWSELKKATLAGEPVKLFGPNTGSDGFVWTGLGNKFFAVYTRPLPEDDAGYAKFIRAVSGLVANPNEEQATGDLLARMLTTDRTIPERSGVARYEFEIYAGPKDADVLRRVNAAYADASALGYHLFHGADMRCFCVPLWLSDLMTWLLQGIMAVLFNGGIAIIVLVVIVRTLLHPLTVFQQKSMFRMQDAMARLQPKLEAIREKYPDDRVKQNQETMRLYADEGVNPLGSMVGFLPLLIQIPILGALWTALNTDIHLRHAPLDGWWIRDLSAPDALIPFNPPFDIPILSWLPLIGWMFQDISAFNLLPILMGVSMWLQQKYMPKPHIEARLEAAKKHGAEHKPRTPGAMSPEEQLRQQQMIANMMAVMFPLMFYYMPSGLNLYWMATNVFGICESLIIRKQLKREKEEKEQRGSQPAAPKQPGLVGRFFKRLAEQAEELQKKADELRELERTRPREEKGERREAKAVRRDGKKKR